jgi:UDP-N-acetylmuramyl tripeptide synthase
MGNIAQKYAKKIYITSDNPRFEKPDEIIEMIAAGISDKEKVIIELDRAEAISMAINELKKDEILLITGKGHEEYQIIGDDKKAFSDYEEVLKCIE